MRTGDAGYARTEPDGRISLRARVISLDGKTVLDVHEWAANLVSPSGPRPPQPCSARAPVTCSACQPTTHGLRAWPNSAPGPAWLADRDVADQSAVTSRCTSIVAIARSQETQRNSYRLVRCADPSRKRDPS